MCVFNADVVQHHNVSAMDCYVVLLCDMFVIGSQSLRDINDKVCVINDDVVQHHDVCAIDCDVVLQCTFDYNVYIFALGSLLEALNRGLIV